MARRTLGKPGVVALLALVTCVAGPTRATQEVIGDEPPHANAAVYPLLDDLKSGDATVRTGAVMAMRELGPVAWPAVPVLIEALSDPFVGVRKGAAGALGGIGPAAEDAVPALIQALTDPHRFVRSWAAMALFEIGPAAKPAAANLIHMMQNDAQNLRGRAWCASALAKLGADPDLAVPALAGALANDDSEEVRSVAVLSLEKYGLEAARRGATHSLSDALSDPHWKVRGNAACALPEMGADAEMALSQLAGALRDDAPYVRGCAAQALGKLGPLALDVAHEIEPLLEDEDDHVRGRAEQALQRLREQKPPASDKGLGAAAL
ncbi:MAG: HEAT repeat domain-containing protein [Chloroflexi bacterium]|nr:HEAT repeat domain-containing protein [Chloroflexota bacterium]